MKEFFFIFHFVLLNYQGDTWMAATPGSFEYSEPILVQSDPYGYKQQFTMESTSISEQADTTILEIRVKEYSHLGHRFLFYFMKKEETFVPFKAVSEGHMTILYISN